MKKGTGPFFIFLSEFRHMIICLALCQPDIEQGIFFITFYLLGSQGPYQPARLAECHIAVRYNHLAGHERAIFSFFILLKIQSFFLGFSFSIVYHTLPGMSTEFGME